MAQQIAFNKTMMEICLLWDGSCPRTKPRKPPPDSSQLELSEGLENSDHEDPLLGGMRSTDSKY